MNALQPRRSRPAGRRRTRRRAPRTEPRLAVLPPPRITRTPVIEPRLPAPRARRRDGMGPGWIGASALAHVALYALIFLAAWSREKPPEPLPPPSYEMVFESGAPERPAEHQPEPPPGEPEPPSEAVPTPPVPPAPPGVAEAEPLPPPPPPVPAPPQVRPPPVPSPQQVRPPPTAPRLAERPPPLPPPPPPLPDTEPLPAPPPLPELAEPRPPEAPRLAETLPPPPPPVPAPPAPRQQQQQQAERPVERLPGLYLPRGLQLSPSPPNMAQRRPQGLRGLDLTLGPTVGRSTIEPQLDVRGAQVGPDWRNAFRRWLEEHKRYPQEAIVLNQQGTTRIQIVAAPDGRVIGAKLVRRSGSVWLDFNTEQLFRGARIPPFPPGADPNGVNIDLTIHYILIRN